MHFRNAGPSLVFKNNPIFGLSLISFSKSVGFTLEFTRNCAFKTAALSVIMSMFSIKFLFRLFLENLNKYGVRVDFIALVASFVR